MTRRAWWAVLVIVITVALCAPPAGAEPPDPVLMTPAAVREIDRAVVFVQAVELANIETAVDTLLRQTATFVAAVTPRPAPAVVTRATQPLASGGGDQLTQEQFERLGICEQSGRDHPFYGRYSIIDGSSGGKSMAEQQAMAQAIYDRAGAAAWDGCAYTLR